MAVGTRRGVTDDAGRAGHAFGNRIFNGLYKRLFGRDFTDIFSGYRAFTRRFVKSFPAVSGGFEIETEMSVHASQLKLPVSEIALDYGRRPEGSPSKLSTFRDGAKILWMFAMLLKETQPMRFFGAIAAIFAAGQPGADDADADRILRDRPGAAHADLGAVARPADVLGDDGRHRAHPRFGVARPRRAEAHLLSQHPGARAAKREARDAAASRGQARSRRARHEPYPALRRSSAASASSPTRRCSRCCWRRRRLDPSWRALSRSASALTVTWLCNRMLTFEPSSRGMLREGARYGGVGITTSIVNYLVYSVLLLAMPWTAAARGAGHRVARRHGAFLSRLFAAGLRPLTGRRCAKHSPRLVRLADARAVPYIARRQRPLRRAPCR